MGAMMSHCVSVFDIRTPMHSWCVCVFVPICEGHDVQKGLWDRDKGALTHSYILKYTEITELVQRPRTSCSLVQRTWTPPPPP